jgi:hypothetical protein
MVGVNNAAALASLEARRPAISCVDMDAFDESVADAAGAGFVAGGDTEVFAMAELDRTAVRNAVLRQSQVRNIDRFLP